MFASTSRALASAPTAARAVSVAAAAAPRAAVSAAVAQRGFSATSFAAGETISIDANGVLQVGHCWRGGWARGGRRCGSRLLGRSNLTKAIGGR